MRTTRAGTLVAVLTGFGACATATLASCRGASEGSATDATPIDARSACAAAAASNRFGFDLYARVIHGDEDLILSPFSAAAALAMTSAGAHGPTLAQMARVLHVEDLASAHVAWGDLVVALGGEEADERDGGAEAAPASAAGAELHVADRIWTERGWTYREDFLSILRGRYRASLGLVDFSGAPDDARITINQWVQEKTKNRIADLLPEGSVDQFTRLVLTNAVYFKGKWQSPFPEGATHDEDFTAPGGRRRVPMMKQLDAFGYAHLDGVQIVELPYGGARMSMVVVLPDDKEGLEAAERRIGRSYDRWMAATLQQNVDLWLPKWHRTQRRSLAQVLEAMGMPLAFKREADFSGMTDEPTLDPGKFYIGDVVQKAFIEVDERGAEAAAATAVVMEIAGSALIGPPPPPPPVVHADHPFLYLIRDRTTGVVLFLGRVDATRTE